MPKSRNRKQHSKALKRRKQKKNEAKNFERLRFEVQKRLTLTHMTSNKETETDYKQ